MGPGPRFEPSALASLIEGQRTPAHVTVAFSGGADSTALLLALATLRPEIRFELDAIHADHGAHPDSSRWAAHCGAVCEALSVPLRCVGPPASLPPGSPEERLRRWRYGQLEQRLSPTGILCTAHHQEDQAETLLLALLRASGPDGLAAMPMRRPLGRGVLLRPLLPYSREQLMAWLELQALPWRGDPRALGDWIEDPGNEVLAPDRNYLRHEVLPRLRDRWPAADRSIARSAGLCAEAAGLLSDTATLALAGRCPAPGILELHGLHHDPDALPTLLRTWLRRSGADPCPRERLEALTGQLADARPDARIEIRWSGHRLRHHRDRLWLDSPSVVPGDVAGTLTPSRMLDLGPVSGTLALEPAPARSATISPPRATPALSVRSRQPGDRIRPRPGGPSRTLKQWLAASSVPPWLRDAIPVIVGDQGLRAIGQHALDPALRDALDAAQLHLRWRPADPGLAWAWSECSGALLRLE